MNLRSEKAQISILKQLGPETMEESWTADEDSGVPEFLLLFCYSIDPREQILWIPTHTVSHPLIWRCWPWLILHLILLSSLPTQYTLAATSGFSLGAWVRLSPFPTFSFPTEDLHLPSLLQQLDPGEYKGHWVNDCSLLLHSGAFLLFPQGTACLPLLLLYKVKCEMATFQELLS